MLSSPMVSPSRPSLDPDSGSVAPDASLRSSSPLLIRAGGGRLRAVAMVLFVACAAATVEATFGSMPGANGEPSTPWLVSMRMSLTSWLLAAALVPAILLIARRFPFRRPGWQVSMAAHVFGAFAFALLHLGLYIVASYLESGRPVPHRWVAIGFNFLRLYSLAEILIYAFVVGAWNAVHFHREMILRERDAAKLRADLTEARLDALRLQLQPHFLFNTLQALTTLARSHETETLVKTVNNLGDLLRALLGEGMTHDIALDDELAFLHKYLEIQHVRFRDRLTVRWEIEEECRVARVPPLILQPLVENAMVHGIDARPGPGTITIGARAQGGRLVLSIEDSGPGFAGSAPARRAGVGLANTRARLEHRWGDRMQFIAHSGPQGGARFEIHIPFDRNGEERRPGRRSE